MATEEGTQHVTIFLKKLRELDAVTTARQYVPKANSTYKDLETVIEGHLESMTKYFAGFPHECRLGSNDRVRLEKAYNRLEGLPKPQKMARDILLSDLQKGLEFESQKDPTSENIRAQRSILEIWQTLKSEKIDNKTIEDAVLKAMTSHDRTIETANSLVDRWKDKKPVKTEVKESTLPLPWSIQVLSTVFPEPRRSFQKPRLTVESKSYDGALTLRASGDGVDEKDLKSRTTIRRLTGLKHSTCKHFVRLWSSLGSRYMVDVRLETTSDGEKFIEHIRSIYKNACTIESSDDLEAQVKNRDVKAARPKSAPPKTKRSIDAVAGSKASSPARKAVKSIYHSLLPSILMMPRRELNLRDDLGRLEDTTTGALAPPSTPSTSRPISSVRGTLGSYISRSRSNGTLTVNLDRLVNEHGTDGIEDNLVIILPPHLNPGLSVLTRAHDGFLSRSPIQILTPYNNARLLSAINIELDPGYAGNHEASLSSATVPLTTEPDTSTPRPSPSPNTRGGADSLIDPPSTRNENPSSPTETENPVQRDVRLFQLGENLRYYLRYDPRHSHSAHLLNLFHEINLCSRSQDTSARYRAAIATEDLQQRRHRRALLAADLRHYLRHDAPHTVLVRFSDVVDEIVSDTNFNHNLGTSDSEFATSNPPPTGDPSTLGPQSLPPPPSSNDVVPGIEVHSDESPFLIASSGVRSNAETDSGAPPNSDEEEPYNHDVRSTSDRTPDPDSTATYAPTNAGATISTSSPQPALMSGALSYTPPLPFVLQPSQDPPTRPHARQGIRAGRITYVWPMGSLSNFENTDTEQESGVVEIDRNGREHHAIGHWHAQGDGEREAEGWEVEGASSSMPTRHGSYNDAGASGSGDAEEQEDRMRLRLERIARRQRAQASRRVAEIGGYEDDLNILD
ncbi:MAG: hypothetical protein Q9202_004221 [Teloschistes flavicans]